MAPAELIWPLKIKQGDTFYEQWGWTDSTGAPVPLTGCSALMQFRERPGSPVLLELSTDNSRIVLVDGLITMTVDAVTMQAFTTTRGVFDLQIEYSDGRIDTIVTGRFEGLLDVAIRGA